MLATKQHCLCDLRRAPLAHPPIYYFPLRYQIMHCAAGFLKRCRVIVAVALVEIDVIRLETFQRRMAGFKDMFTREPPVIYIVAHREETLGCKYEFATPICLQCSAECFLRPAIIIYIRGIEKIYSKIQRRTNKSFCMFSIHRPAHSQP